MKTIRSFLALNINVETARSIAKIQESLVAGCKVAGVLVNWVPPQNMHITMRFLGNITEPMIRAIKDNVEEMTRDFPPLELELKGMGVFPDLAKPKVLWVGIHSRNGELARLYESLSKVLEETGFKTDDKPFRSHLTIGRVKSDGKRALSAIFEEFSDSYIGVSTPRNLVCYRSDLHRKGADYHMLWKLPFLGTTTQGAEADMEGAERTRDINGDFTQSDQYEIEQLDDSITEESSVEDSMTEDSMGEGAEIKEGSDGSQLKE